MIIYEDIEQRTDEWYRIRDLKFTASHASTILAEGAGLKTLIKEILADHYSSKTYEEFSDKYTNNNIERGNEFEDKARTIYEMEVCLPVKQVGFVEMSDHVGCSPDGMVGDEGLVEIKNHNDKYYVNLLLTNKIEKKYYNQMQMQLYVTDRKWCDYFAFNPNFPEKPFVLIRVYPDEITFGKLRNALERATNDLLEQKKIIDDVINERRQ